MLTIRRLSIITGPQVLMRPKTALKLKYGLLAAQRTNVDTVSGAPADSMAYLKAVESALSAASAK